MCPPRIVLFAFVLSLGACGSAAIPPCPDAGTALTYDNFGSGFMRTYCVRCHAGDRVEHHVDLSTREQIIAQGTKVVSSAGIGSSMPPSPELMPDEIERAQLVEWMSCGAP
jgi:uncharacterized membrane protein